MADEDDRPLVSALVIGVDDPKKEPEPPELEKAGDLGPVGERKQEKADLKYKDGIWRDGPVAESEPANKKKR